MEKLCLVYVTASSKEEAEKIAKHVISLKLAACANINDGVTSFYRWEGKEETSREATIVLKTREALLPQLNKAIREVHSYSCPCVVAIPVIYVDKDYGKWIMKETHV